MKKPKFIVKNIVLDIKRIWSPFAKLLHGNSTLTHETLFLILFSLVQDVL